MVCMDENPYQSPRTHGSAWTRETQSSLFRTLSRRTQFFVGCAVLAPVSWLMGRGLIPPDDVALRFSFVVWPVLAAVWGLFVWRQSWLGRNQSL